MCEQQRRNQPAHLRRLISAFLVRCSSFFFSTKKRFTNLNGEQNDTWNLLVSHRICHFRSIQPFDLLCNLFGAQYEKMYKPWILANPAKTDQTA